MLEVFLFLFILAFGALLVLSLPIMLLGTIVGSCSKAREKARDKRLKDHELEKLKDYEREKRLKDRARAERPKDPFQMNFNSPANRAKWDSSYRTKRQQRSAKAWEEAKALMKTMEEERSQRKASRVAEKAMRKALWREEKARRKAEKALSLEEALRKAKCGSKVPVESEASTLVSALVGLGILLVFGFLVMIIGFKGILVAVAAGCVWSIWKWALSSDVVKGDFSVEII